MGPMLAAGASSAGREVKTIEVIANPMTATGVDAAAVKTERDAAREILTFTYSTPAYWATLDHHGWGEVGRRLLEKTRSGDWAGMNGLITDEMLDVLVPSAALHRDRGGDPPTLSRGPPGPSACGCRRMQPTTRSSEKVVAALQAG